MKVLSNLQFMRLSPKHFASKNTWHLGANAYCCSIYTRIIFCVSMGKTGSFTLIKPALGDYGLSRIFNRFDQRILLMLIRLF